MTMPPTDPTDADRPVLLWGPESDESQVHPSVERAAAFLDVAPKRPRPLPTVAAPWGPV